MPSKIAGLQVMYISLSLKQKSVWKPQYDKTIATYIVTV